MKKPDYWHWHNYLPRKNIKKINELIESNSVDAKDRPADSKKTSQVKFIEYKTIKPYLMNCIKDIYATNEKNFGFSLNYFYDHLVLNYNIYSKNSEYNWHVDHDPEEYQDLKLTVLINLSEKKYKGGKFLYRLGEKPHHVKALDEPGSMIMFRSHYLHKVTPVTEGERRTLSIFLMGPRLQ